MKIFRRITDPYFLLLCLSFGQSFILLRAEQSIGLKIFAAISAFAFYLLLLQISVRLYKAALIFSLILCIFIFPSLHVYGFPDKNLISNIFYTNTGEAWSYLKVVPVIYYVILAGLTVYTIFLLLNRYKKIHNSYLNVVLIAILILPIIFSFVLPSQLSFIDTDQRKVNIAFVRVPIIKIPLLIGIEGYQVVQTNKDILEKARREDNWNVINSNIEKKRKNIVIVIGEAVRQDFLSCYGFPIETTPFVDSTPHIQFDNFISVGAYTVPVLTRTIVHSDPFPKFELPDNIVNLAKKAGYKTYWLSNQGYIGIYDSPISIIAGASDHFFKFNGGDFHTKKMDVVMLPDISEIIKNDTTPKVIFVHMIGNHPDITDRTNGHYDQFFLSKEVSCYIQAVKNTDTFLSTIYHDLKSTGEDFGLVYFSDHGVGYRPEFMDFTHGYSIKESYRVPLLIWGSDVDTTTRIGAYRNGRNFLNLFCELFDIKTTNLRHQVKFLSEEPANDSVFMVMGENDEIQDFRSFKSNKVENLSQ